MAEQQNLVEIETSAGRRTYPADASLYVVSAGNFTPILAGHLQEGSKILWRKDSIDATLEEIEPYLFQSWRYALAEKNSFVRVADRKAPRFWWELRKAAEGMEETEPASLEELLLEDNMTSPDISRLANAIYEGLFYAACDEGTPEREESTVARWLRGATVAPSELEVLRGLEIATGHKIFKQWYDEGKRDPTDINTFWGANKFYTTVRQQIMRYLSGTSAKLPVLEQAKGETDETQQKSMKEESGRKIAFDLTPEIQLVVNGLIDQVDENTVSAKVFKVGAMEETGAGDVRKKPHPGLRDGAYTGQITGNTKSMSELLTDRKILAAAYDGLILEYLDRIGRGSQASLLKDVLARFSQSSAGVMITSVGGEFDIMSRDGDSLGERLNEEFKGLLKEAIESGSIENAFGLPEFTGYKLLDATQTLLRNIPDTIKDYSGLKTSYLGLRALSSSRGMKFTRSEKSLLEKRRQLLHRELNDLKRNIPESYDMGLYRGNDQSFMLKNDLLNLVVLHSKSAPVELFFNALLDVEESKIERIYGTPTPYITAKKARDTLKIYGLDPQLADTFIERDNFVLDKGELTGLKIALDYGNHS